MLWFRVAGSISWRVRESYLTHNVLQVISKKPIPHKSVNLVLISEEVKDKLINLREN